MKTLYLALSALLLSCVSQSAMAQQYWTDQPVIGDWNFYVQPPHDGGAAAELYPSPRPTPPYVGHTYYTYEPFAPHQFMYKHYRVYRKNHWEGGKTTTRVLWF